MHVISEMKQNLAKKKERQDIVLYTSANPHTKSEAVLDMYNLSQKSLIPFFN